MGMESPETASLADDSYRERGTVGFDRSSEGGIFMAKRALGRRTPDSASARRPDNDKGV
jgi:hypothetical protein